jgi:ATP-dependent exoDNAse (exonuclease V) alpha subunit
VFKDKTVGRLLTYEYSHLKKSHKPNSNDAVPILKQKKTFTINRGEVRYQRTQFPITLSYAITAHKCQGDTLDEVVIDFSHEPGDRVNIPWGSFYVALTRVKEGKNVFLKTFDEKQITFNIKVENKIAAMR